MKLGWTNPVLIMMVKRSSKEHLKITKILLSRSVLVKSDLSTGFSDKVIDQILVVCDQVHSTEDIMEQVDVWDTEQAAVVLSLIQKICGI